MQRVFDARLSSLQTFMNPYAAGYQAPSTAAVNPDSNTVVWGDAADATLHHDLLWAPKAFWLRCRLVGQPLAESSAEVSNHNVAWSHLAPQKPSRLYDPAIVKGDTSLRRFSLYQSMSLVMTGEGQAEASSPGLSERLTLERRSFGSFMIQTDPTGAIFTHDFMYCRTRTFQQTVTWDAEHEDQYRITPPGQPATIPLYAFAGYYNPAEGIGQAQQAFFQIDFDYAPSTHIRISLAQSWLQQGIAFPEGGLVMGQRIHFMPTEPNHQAARVLTFAHAIVGGHIVLALAIPGTSTHLHYKSVRFHDGAPGEADIYFLPV